MNPVMRPIYDAAMSCQPPILPAELEAVISAGFILSHGRLFLVRPEHTSAPGKDLDDWEAERWVNKIHLESARPATEESWRVELVSVGIELARRLLVQAVGLTAWPVQAIVALQSSADEVDPEVDFATGSVQVFSARSTQDDLGANVEKLTQPALVLTERSSS